MIIYDGPKTPNTSNETMQFHVSVHYSKIEGKYFMWTEMIVWDNKSCHHNPLQQQRDRLRTDTHKGALGCE